MYKLFLTLTLKRLAGTHPSVRREAESPIWRATTVRGEAESPTWRATYVRAEAESPNLTAPLGEQGL